MRATGDDEQPYELLAGQRRFAAMRLIDEADEAEEWRLTLVDGISRREALTMQFAENFHQSKPEPVKFARAARLIMAEDPALTAAEVSRIVGAPPAWTRKALRLLELPDAIVERVSAATSRSPPPTSCAAASPTAVRPTTPRRSSNSTPTGR